MRGAGAVAVAALLLAALPPAVPAPAAAQAAPAGIAPAPAAVTAPSVELPEVVLRSVPFTLVVLAPAGLDSVRLRAPAGGWDRAPVAGERAARPLPAAVAVRDGRAEVDAVRLLRSRAPLRLSGGGAQAEVAPRALPGWLSVLPALVAIGLALLFRQVVPALLLGVWLGAWILYDWNPLLAFLRLGDRFLVAALASGSHAAIIIFSTLLGGMVGVLTRAGATEGLVRSLATRVSGRRGGQRVTALMGTVIFFDDYANTLLVGNSMRPLTDRLRISREKLAYLVDSTAAPVTAVAVVSTWIGFEVGLIQQAMASIGWDEGGAYSFFLRTIPYSFYPLLTLVFVYLVALTGRDFGPMRAAELRARHRGLLLRAGAQPAADTMALDGGGERPEPGHPLLAIVPVAVVILATVGGLWYDGASKLAAAGEPTGSLRAILNAADSFAVLMWASLGGAATAIAGAMLTRRLSLRQALDGWTSGAQAMLVAVVILLLAWSLSEACTALQTAPWLVEVCRGALSARLLPALAFALAAAISFATGTSWGTMAIMMPLVFPLGAILPGVENLPAATGAAIHMAATRAVMAGAVFGDHCSPISDTTIMSSLATGSDHVDHVRTQLPYALTVAAVAMAVGYLPSGWGVPPLVGLGVGAALLAVLLLRLGATTRREP